MGWGGDRTEPPGPKGGIFLGNAARYRADPLAFLSLCREFASPLVRVDHNAYLVSNPSLIEAVFHDKNEIFVKTLPASTKSQMVNFPASVMNSSGQDWHQKRKFLQPVFHHRQVDRSVMETFAVAERHLDEWLGDLASTDIRARLQPLCLDAGCHYLFGSTLDDVERATIIALADAIMHKTRDQNRFRIWPFDHAEARLTVALQRARGIIDGMLARTRQSTANNNRLGTITGRQQGEPGDWLRDEFAAMILSGLEPMADALAWTLHLLVRHPSTLERVVAEIDAAKSTGDIGSTAGLTHMTETSAAVKEALRLFPPAWMTGRIVARDTQLGGFDLPQGAALMISPWVNHRDRRNFDAPDHFRTDRWLDGTLEQRLPRYAFFPFGGGSRRCIGEHFSMTHMVAILVCLLGRYALREVPGADVRPFPALVLRPSGIRMVLTPRPVIAMGNRRCS